MLFRIYFLVVVNMFIWRLAHYGLESSLSIARRSKPCLFLRLVCRKKGSEIITAVHRAAQWTVRWSPGRATCLPVALAGVTILRRLGVPAVLSIGVASRPLFEAHAWVEVNGRAVLDPEEFLPDVWKEGIRQRCQVILRV